MLISAAVAVGIATGVPVIVVAGMGAATLEPRLALLVGAAALVAARWSHGHHRRDLVSAPEMSFHQSVAAELRAGASLRSALSRATDAVPELGMRRLARASEAGLPMPYLQAVMRECLPETGPATAAALSILEETGGHAISTFEGLALVAQDAATVDRDRRVSTAQVRASATLVGGIPLVFILFLAFTGRFGEVAGQAPAMLILGGLWLAIGAIWMGWMLRSARSGGGPFRHRRHAEGDLILPQLLFIGLTAGLSLGATLARAQSQLERHQARAVAHLLRQARSSGMAAALASQAGSPLYRILARAHVTGAPLAAVVGTFITQRREAHRAEQLARVRKLPIKLLVPLSLFILPGFVFLTVGPTLVHHLTRLLGPFFG